MEHVLWLLILVSSYWTMSWNYFALMFTLVPTTYLFSVTLTNKNLFNADYLICKQILTNLEQVSWELKTVLFSNLYFPEEHLLAV